MLEYKVLKPPWRAIQMALVCHSVGEAVHFPHFAPVPTPTNQLTANRIGGPNLLYIQYKEYIQESSNNRHNKYCQKSPPGGSF